MPLPIVRKLYEVVSENHGVLLPPISSTSQKQSHF